MQVIETSEGRMKEAVRFILSSPARLTIVGFSALILLGTGLLMLPWSAEHDTIGFVNALFTATSAVCVTGLTVVDTASAFSYFGQATILGLIQVGGLGFMTVSTLLLMMAGRRPSLSGRKALQDTFTHGREHTVPFILREVMIFTFAFEGVGAALMFPCFLPHGTAGNALYVSVFHSISAFCNAGFSLFPQSLSPYREHWILNWIVCLLVICGGLGFPVLAEIRDCLVPGGRRLSRLSLHSKLVLSTTAFLLSAGAILIFFMESRNTLSSLSPPSGILAAFFQSVSARTAGFNTLPIGGMANETLFLLILLMFIGASPGSCGGGIKTTTFSTLFVLGISRLRGHAFPVVFGRTISGISISKAVSVLMMSMLVVFGGTLLLQVTELGGVSHALSRGKFLELYFEVVSAFGTVGLSTGVTGTLTVPGKFLIALVMFVGRLGPLVVAAAVSRRLVARFRYAEESIMIG